MLDSIASGDEFVDMLPEALYVKEKVDKLSFNKIQNFQIVKDIAMTMKK